MENFFKSVFWDMLTFVLDHIRRDIEVLQGAIAVCPNSNGRKDGVKMGQQASTLRRHFRIHTGEMKHQCKVCSRKFVDDYANVTYRLDYPDNGGTDTTTESTTRSHNTSRNCLHVKHIVER